MLLPDKRIADRLVNERCGVWVANSANVPRLWLVAKLPNHTIREVQSGADVKLSVYVVNVDDVHIAVFGFTIYDDLVHPQMVTGACRSQLEIKNLLGLLKLDHVPIQFHNENGIPLLNATCSWDSAEVKSVVESLPDDHPADGYESRQRALDIVQNWSDDQTQVEPRLLTQCTLPLDISNLEVFNVHLPTVGTVNLDDTDRGKELEILTLQLFDEAFPFGAYHSPQRQASKGMLEVCDVLAVSRITQVANEGIFVVQNKVAATDGKIRTLDRRGATIRKNIRKAVKQSVGAIKKIKSATQLYKIDGTKIEEDCPETVSVVEPLDLAARAQEVGYGIILVSEMHEGVDWTDVFVELVEATQETGYYHYVLDLWEMYGLIANSNRQPAILESYLIQRWEKMVSEKTAMIRSKFVHGE